MPPSGSASTSATPYAGPSSPTGSDWSTASNAFAGRASVSGTPSRALARRVKPKLSELKQEILSEEEYVIAMSTIIKRDFFPQLAELDARDDVMRAFASEDPLRVEESVRRMRELVTPTPRRRGRGATPGRTPFDESDMTPTYFSETPMTNMPTPLRRARAAPDLRYDPTLSLDTFQSRYTSEDNSSFAVLLSKDNAARREKFSWAWDAEKKANQKAIKGREAREQLVEMTRKMVESDANGCVTLIQGAPGRPGERKMLVQGATGDMGRLMVGGTKESGRLMLEDGKGKGKGQLEYVDMDKPTAEEEEEGRFLRQEEMQVPMEGFTFTNRNSFMFPPDADVPLDRDPIVPTPSGLPPGEPKSIRYHATRLEQVSQSDPGVPSPSRSRINAAITGTPYPVPVSATPKVSGFSFVAALPTPRASAIDPQDLQDLMTWGTISSTPVALRSAGSIARSGLGDGGGPFRIVDTSHREVLAHKMASRAKRSLSDRAAALDPSKKRSSGSHTLRRSVLDSTGGLRDINDSTRSPRGGGGGAELSPAARTLLGRAGKSTGGSGDQGTDVGRRLRAVARAREVESRDRMRRERWSASPAPSMGFDEHFPDDEFETVRLKGGV